MDFLKTLEAFEELLYRLALWVVLIPKTLAYVVFFPHRIASYVAEENSKGPEDRFKGRMSPVLFWALIAVAPHLMLLNLLAAIPDSRVAMELEWVAFMKAPMATRLIFLSITALAGPLVFALGVVRRMGKNVNRDTLRTPFAIQCYCLTPVYVLLLPVSYQTLRSDTLFPSGEVSLCLAFVWMLAVETITLPKQVPISYLRAFGRTWLLAMFVFVVFVGLEMAAITLFGGLAVWR